MSDAEALERLAALHGAGELTDDEFAQAKAKVLADSQPTSDPAPTAPPSRGAGARKKWLALLGVGLCASLVIALVVGARSGRSKSVPLQINGNQVANELLSQVADRQGQPLQSANCPNERLVVGDKTACTVNFADGSYKTVRVTIQDVNGRIKLEIG